MPGSTPLSTSRPVIIGVVASGYLPHLPFGAIGLLGPYDSGCTLKLLLQPHWMALELLVGDGPGVENHAQLWFGMWLVVLPAQGDHAIPCPIMTGWLTYLLEIFDGFHR